MGEIEQRLAERGLVLPSLFSGPGGMRVPFDLVRIDGSVAYVSGHGPMDGAQQLMTGKLGDESAGGALSIDDGYEAARLTCLSMLASLKDALGDLDRVTGWLKLLGFVNVAPGFTATPPVINGFSDLILDLWGERGHHARSAIGVAELPFAMPVEVEAVVALGEG
jgi:enamine deaminase RidA (YjgF/YER057c/UK114 family)